MTTMKIKVTPEMRIQLMHAETIEIDVPDAPEGWILVPVEPTEAMLAEICLTDGFQPRALRNRYIAMLSAAPVPEGGAA